ncbi:unnamed protein product [Ixodes hexagonus]
MIATLRARLTSYQTRSLISGALRNQQYSTVSNPVTKQETTQAPLDDEDMPHFDMPNPYQKEGRKCILCKHNIEVDYKNVKLLSQFVSSYTGKIYEKHITGLCEKQQLRVKGEIFKARKCGLMPHYLKMPKFLKDPRLFDPFNPSRPNPH